jgi:hypothetical protein
MAVLPKIQESINRNAPIASQKKSANFERFSLEKRQVKTAKGTVSYNFESAA